MRQGSCQCVVELWDGKIRTDWSCQLHLLLSKPCGAETVPPWFRLRVRRRVNPWTNQREVGYLWAKASAAHPCLAAIAKRALPRVPRLCFPAQTALYQGTLSCLFDQAISQVLAAVCFPAGAASSASLPPPLAVFPAQLLRGRRSCFSCIG